MLRANFRRSYIKSFTKDDGVTLGRRTVYVYGVIGKKEELEHYKKVQASKINSGEVPVDVEPSGAETPLFFTNRLLPNNIDLEITQNNNIVVLNDELTELEQLRDNDPSELGRAALSQVIVAKQVELVRAKTNMRRTTNPNETMPPTVTVDPLGDEEENLEGVLDTVGKDAPEEGKEDAPQGGRRNSSK